MNHNQPEGRSQGSVVTSDEVAGQAGLMDGLVMPDNGSEGD